MSSLGALAMVASLAASAADVESVLVLYSASRLLPANVAGDRGIREALRGARGSVPEVYDEFLDASRFEDTAHAQALANYLREKYAARRPAVLIAIDDTALEFLLRHRTSLFPRVPIVHAGIPEGRLQSLAPLPGDVIGVPVAYRFAETIELALRLRPQARRVVIVTGTSAQDREWERQLRRDAAQLRDRATFEFDAGMTAAAVEARLRNLPADAVVFTPGFFRDGAGTHTLPRDTAAAMAAASAVPVFGPFDTFIGTGVVGGYVPSFEGIGRQAGELAGALLAGAAPTSLRVPAAAANRLVVDWRAVRRWNIDPTTVPADADIRFREPTLFEAHRTEVFVALAVFVLQAALIVGLLIERRRRRVAESAVLAQRSQLAHASRLAVAGELTGSIAHEINQPLGAILSNADAADLILQSGADRREEVRAILADIRRDDLRASEVIRALRALLAKHEVTKAPCDANEVVRDIEPVLRGEARRREVAFDVRYANGPAPFVGDRVQIQQAVINLALNAMEAMSDAQVQPRRVSVSIEPTAGWIAIAVRDRGPGIAPGQMAQLFDPFFTTKRSGMGLGLSIVRTLVEAHGGRVRAENRASGGAVFHVELPAAIIADVAAGSRT